MFCCSQFAPIIVRVVFDFVGGLLLNIAGYLPGALERKFVSCVYRFTRFHYLLGFSNGSTTCMDFRTMVFFLTIMDLLKSIMYGGDSRR